MKRYIQNLLTRLLADLGVSDDFPNVDISDTPEHGDYTTNIAMKLSKQLKKSPMQIGEELKDRLEKDEALKKIGVEKIDVVPPGFINFTISNERLYENFSTLCEKNHEYGKGATFSGKKIMVEYTDPNPFKELHIGHLYSNSVGESIARLLTYAGAEVKRADYFGDVGMHVAKTLWGLMKKMADENKDLADIEKLPLLERIHYLALAYALGAKAYEDTSEEGKKDIETMKDMNYLVYVAGQEYLQKEYGFSPQVDYKQYATGKTEQLDTIRTLYSKGRTWSMDYFKTVFTRLGTTFDYYYPESMTGEYGTEIVRKHIGDVFESSDGAIIFRGESYGFHTRVFINSLGLPTYETKELGLAVKKFSDFPFDLCLNITGNEINDYFKVVLTALGQIDPILASKITHIGHGMVRLPEGKMSSRSGKAPTAQWFFEEVKQKVREVLKAHNFPETDIESVAEKETIAAIKYSFLKVALPGNLTFDIDTSVSFEGDSGPYLLYTYARCMSVMKISGQSRQLSASSTQTLNEEEHAVARLLLFFPDIVDMAATKYAPSILCEYLYDLAQVFNLFYAKHTIVGSDTRLVLTQAVAKVIKTGLTLLGIPTVERM